MYVCICRGVTEGQLRLLVKQCEGCVEEIISSSGVGCDCGCCQDKVQDIIEEYNE